MYRRLGIRAAAAGLSVPADGSAEPGDGVLVTDADLAYLPEVVQRYLRPMSVLGRPRDRSFGAHFKGRFQLRGRGRWMPAEVWQYNAAPQVARIFLMRLDFAGAIPMVGADTYAAGRGLMRGKLLDLITVAHAKGFETDMSELVTYLNDLVLLAPSMLLRLPVTFTTVDETSFRVTLRDGEQTVTATVWLDESGRPRDFATTDRYADLPAGLVRARWTTPIEGWTTDSGTGRPLPTRGRAIWHLDTGPQPYLEFTLAAGDITYNMPPGPAEPHDAGGGCNRIA